MANPQTTTKENGSESKPCVSDATIFYEPDEPDQEDFIKKVRGPGPTPQVDKEATGAGCMGMRESLREPWIIGSRPMRA